MLFAREQGADEAADEEGRISHTGKNARDMLLRVVRRVDVK